VSTSVTQIASDGWQATYPAPPAFDPESTPETLRVTRQGFDQSASPAQSVEDLTLMARVRDPYPNQGTLSADQVALSDFVYAGDAIAGVSNTSTRAYPKPIAMWLNHDRERASGATHTLRLAVAHAHARAGQPVAAVTFILSDGLSTVEQTVSNMTATTYAASGLSVPHFAADMDLSALAQGALLVVDAVIYPWVGTPFTISVDADAYPSPNLSTLRLLNDRTGAYGTAYAYVDATLGDNGTGVVSQVAANAQGSPFASVTAAATALKTFNSTTFGRANDAGGGIIRLEAGTHVRSNFRSAGASVDIPLVIEAANPANRATTVFTDGGSSTSSGTPYQLKLKNITLQNQGGSVIFLDSGVGDMLGLLVTENCVFDRTAGSSWGAWVYRVGRFQMLNCGIGPNGDPMATHRFSAVAKTVQSIGCDQPLGTLLYGSVGSSNVNEFIWRAAEGPKPEPAGVFLGWNVFSNGTTTNGIVTAQRPIGARGFAVVGNLIEAWGSVTGPTLQINADNDTSVTQNVVVQANTIVGERANLLYLDGSTNVEKSGYFRANVFERYNIKGDIFASQSGNTGNWSMRYKVGWSHNAALQGANNETGYSTSSWLGEIPGLGGVTGIAAGWSDDRSNVGSDTGSGSYLPTAGSALPMLPAALACYNVDLKGAPFVPGASRIGAVWQVG
jgi:hypothetical protein